MRNLRSYVIAGLGIGALCGVSTGVALGGAAYNGALIFGPLGAFVGWLFARGGEVKTGADETSSPADDFSKRTEISEPKLPHERNEISLAGVIHSGLALLATVWNFHIEMLRVTNLLPWFQTRPWLFLVVALAVSVPFPPFFVLYFVCYLGAAHFGMSEKTGFRANVT